MADFNANVEEQKCERNGVRGQTDVTERAGKTEPMQQAERERDDPGASLRETWLSCRIKLPSANDLAATNTMLRAIIASTGGPGTLTTPSVAARSVMLWVT